jgi:1-aminocyclopropane-1-carboxylate deaminase/D-cysteine desulfhydrase-like pyridoxal-dependent ACC family enzyme
MPLGLGAKIACVSAVATLSGIASVLKIMSMLSHNLGTCPPTKEQLEEENQENCALFRHVPNLKIKIAWRELGNFPTPIHKGKVMVQASNTSPKEMHFYVKREDLASPKYGGNKVRTLQHQLGVAEARAERGDMAAKKIIVAGSGGSNQILATVVHSQNLSPKMPKITPVWVQPDKPDLDNTLNFLSTLTMSNVEEEKQKTWGDSDVLSTLIAPLFWGDGLVLPPGGNNPAGCLGQISGALELAEQIERGEVEDPDRIYVPVGSSCTVSGLILGIVLARQLGLKAFKKTQVCGVIIHHGAAAGQRATGVLTAWWAKYIPLTIRHTLHATAGVLSNLGGPDLLNDALFMVDNGGVRIIDAADLVGVYGGHSDVSLLASKEYEKSGEISDVSTGKIQEQLWLCGHFAGKAFSAMRRDFLHDIELQSLEGMRAPLPVCLFWQTKSRVQPRGEVDTEWDKFLNLPESVQKWGREGKNYNETREGIVDTTNHDTGQQGYRHLMSKI